MADALSLFPPRVQFVDPATGLLTQPAFRSLQVLFSRVGGAQAPSINELSLSDDEDSGLDEMRHEFGKVLDGLSVEPREVDGELRKELQALQLAPQVQEQQRIEELETQVSSALAVIAELRKELDDLKQGQMI